MLRIVLAGGGSAGHIEPALAVADALVKLDSQIRPEIIGTAAGLEARLVPARGYQLRMIPKVILPRQIGITSVFFPIRIMKAFLSARKEISGAVALVGFGGYVSAASYLAAFTLGIPITIHEANSKPGWANRMGRFLARQVAVNFPSVGRRWKGSTVTGMPISDAISKLATVPAAELDGIKVAFARRFGLDSKRPIILIFGGSLGSRNLNAAVERALQIGLGEAQLVHSLGWGNQLPPAKQGYVPVPYLDDMASAYAAADLVISRSGAVTCSELITVGKFAVLVPLAHGNGEQLQNAEELVGRGQALLVRDAAFNGEWLAENLPVLLAKARNFGDNRSKECIDSAEQIAQLALSTISSTGEIR